MDLITAYLANKMSGGDSYTKAETDALLDGKADLVDGKVPAAQLPSYVDDTIEGYYYNGNFYEDSEHTTAITGESGKIYIDLAANKSYRWTGNVYVRIDECPAFGETAGTIYEGNKGKANADAIAAIKDGTNIDSFADVETALANKADKSTTYTKTEVDAALAGKLNTADVDVALSSTSTNPVQNKAVQAPIARLVDAGAKNLAAIETSTPHVSNGITFTASNGLINASGTASDSADAVFAVFGDKTLKPGNYCVSGCPSGGAIGKYRIDLVVDGNVYRDVGSDVSFTVASNASVRMQIVVYRGNSVNDLTFKPMLCTAEDYAISPEFVPYAPSNRELYEMILALQNAQNGG